MHANEADQGDGGCPLSVAPAADEQTFFGGPIRYSVFVNLPLHYYLVSGIPMDISSYPMPRLCAGR